MNPVDVQAYVWSNYLVGLSLAAVLVLAAYYIRTAREHESGIFFGLGRLTPMRGPGFRFIPPLGIDRVRMVDLRAATLEVPPRGMITSDDAAATRMPRPRRPSVIASPIGAVVASLASIFFGCAPASDGPPPTTPAATSLAAMSPAATSPTATSPLPASAPQGAQPTTAPAATSPKPATSRPTTPQTTSATSPLAAGNDKDSHGCIASAGYSWCEKAHDCIRSWDLAKAKGLADSDAVDRYCAGK